MIINNIYDLQQKLDDAIEVAHGVKPKEVSNKKVLAALVEISEFANELSTFKYWKKNKNINHENTLLEYADGLHFFISFYVQLEIRKEIKPFIEGDINEMFIKLFKYTADLYNNINEELLDKAFSIYLGIAELTKLDWEEVEEFYIKKNKINFERIKNNY